MSADLLANVERIEPEPVEGEPVPGYFAGPATSHVEHWRSRALVAEALVEQLRRALSRYRVRP